MTALNGVNGTVCTAQQYQQSLQSSDSNSPWLSCLTRGESIGLVFAAEASTLSCICIIVTFMWIGRNILWYRKKCPNDNWKLFQGPADIYMLSLLAFDLVQAAGGILNIRWAHNGIVTTGPYCTAQGIVEQVGELGVALIILILAIHTFVAAVLHVGLTARGVALNVVFIACIFIALWVVIGPHFHKNYETPTPYWCWISPQFPRERFAGETIWMWIALFVSAILYIPLFFWAKGFWSVRVDEGYKFQWHDSSKHRSEYPERRATLGMLLYPLAYSVIILPLTIARFVQFGHHNVPSAVTFSGVSIFYLSGAINVALFLIVRPGLLLFPRPNPEELVQPPDVELAPQGTHRAMFSDTANFRHSPEPSTSTLRDGGCRDSATPSGLKSRPISDADI